jgi:hypothetical protein
MTGKFALYHKSRPEIPRPEDVMTGESEEPDWSVIEPDRVIEGYTKAMNLVEEKEYAWRELNVDSAPIRTVCSECDVTVQTHSEERYEEKVNIHHIQAKC